MTPQLTAALVIDAKAELGECPVWDDRNGQILWVDIDAGVVHNWQLGTGTVGRREVGQPVGAIGLRASGGLVLAVRDGFGFLEESAFQLVAPVEVERRTSRMNDGAVDPQGGFVAGTMDQAAADGAGSLYRFGPDLDVRCLLTELTIPNGLGWSPAGDVLYFADSMGHGPDRWRWDPTTSTMTEPEQFASIDRTDGLPDGLTVDSEGGVWIAVWGGSQVRRYSPDGELLAVVALPVSQPTSVTFGGPDLAELYITSAWQDLTPNQRLREPLAGGVFVVRPGVTGLAPDLFRG